jgi:hypothetical protein
VKTSFWKKVRISLCGLCLIACSLTAEDGMDSQNKMMMGQMMKMQMAQEMTESELLQQMDDKDKAVYQKLDSAGKALVLKMANTAKMNNNPMMMMQNCMTMMNMMMSKMKMMMDTMDKQKGMPSANLQ